MAGKANALKHGIKFKDKIGYALGDMGCQLSFALVGSFLQMFYTDALHISLGKITVLMLVARIWDAINDPIWGSIIDARKPSKHGKFRPYLIWVSFPLAVSSVLMFVKIPNLTENGYLVFAYITYIMYGMLYTAMNIPYGSLASVITDDANERSDLSVFRSIGAGVGGLPAQILLPLFVYSTAVDTGVKYLDANKLTGAVALLAGFSLIVYFACFKMTKERVVSPIQAKKPQVKNTIKTLLKNRPFLVLCVASMLLLTVTMYTQTIYNYLYKNYFEKPELYSLVTIFTYLPMVMLLPFLGKLVRRFGKKSICAAGALFSGVANFGVFFLRTTNPYYFLIFCFLSGLGITFFTMEVWALVTDVIDYQELLSGKREEGTSYAFFSFTRKLGQTIAGSGGTLMLAWIGYDVSKTTIVQDPQVIHSMYTIATLVPAILYLLIFLLLWFGYPLSKAKVKELQENLSKQRQTYAENKEEGKA